MFRQLLNSFRKEASHLFERLDAGASGDAESLRVAAHTLKSSAADFGATTLREQLAELERLGQSGDLEAAQSLLKETMPEWRAVEAELCALAENMQALENTG